jgi:tungstate transport system permease protein
VYGPDGELWSIVGLTLRVSLTALLLSTVFGVPIGAWLGLARFPGKSVFTALVYTLMGLPPVVVGLAIYMLLSRRGPLAALEWLYTPQAMILAQTIIATPLVTGLVMGAVASVQDELILQVRSLGATSWQVRWTVLREVRTGVLFAVLAAFGRIISEVGAALMVGGNIQGQTRVLTTAIVLGARRSHVGHLSEGRVALFPLLSPVPRCLSKRSGVTTHSSGAATLDNLLPDWPKVQ